MFRGLSVCFHVPRCSCVSRERGGGGGGLLSMLSERASWCQGGQEALKHCQ